VDGHETNFFVALAPYRFRSTALMLAAVFFFGINYFYPLRPYWRGIFVAAGFKYGFTWR